MNGSIHEYFKMGNDVAEMTLRMREDACAMIRNAIQEVLPGNAVRKALENYDENADGILVIAIGKAAWEMAASAKEILQDRIKQGLIITKYGHSKDALDGFEIVEAGHPIPDSNSVYGAELAIRMLQGADENDRILLLISGGGSALMEMPAEGISLKDIQNVTGQLLRCGASIQEINKIRKRLSLVKGGKLAMQCPNLPIYQIVLSDIIDDDLEQIASGPACEDTATNQDIKEIVTKYGLQFPEKIQNKLYQETPKKVGNVKSNIVGSVKELCSAMAEQARQRGYSPVILSTQMDCEAKEAGKLLASVARTIQKGQSLLNVQKPCAIILGGETTVTVHGEGKGGRNQEIALSAAIGIEGIENTVVFSVGSDGTDGPTDAAGGMVDGTTIGRMRQLGIDAARFLAENDSYHALGAVDDLIVTGPTGTNVNDVTVILCK